MNQFLKTASALVLTIGLTVAGAMAQARNPVVKGFDELKLSAPFEVTVTMGSAESVKVDASDEDLARMDVFVRDGDLVLRVKEESNRGRRNQKFGKVHIAVSAKNLNEISIAGSGNVKLVNILKATDLDLKITGSGNIEGMLDVDKVESEIAGSGGIKLSGTAKKSEISIAGSGNYTPSELKSGNTEVCIGGSGNAKVHAADRLQVSLSGSGDVQYSGSPAKVNSTVSGSGTLSKI